jgi:hypothetical protein
MLQHLCHAAVLVPAAADADACFCKLQLMLVQAAADAGACCS